jgi:hypothetical protein
MLRDVTARLADPCTVLAVSVTTFTKVPLTGEIELQTSGGALKYSINEEIAQTLASDLDRFLSQS